MKVALVSLLADGPADDARAALTESGDVARDALVRLRTAAEPDLPGPTDHEGQ